MDHQNVFNPIDILYENRRRTLTIFSEIQHVVHTPGITEKLEIRFNRLSNSFEIRSIDGLITGIMVSVDWHLTYVNIL